MAEIFRIDMLPAREGDCLWIEYGDKDRPHRVLIDGGRHSAYDALKTRFQALPADQRQFELAMLTHVDADHIEGFLRLAEDVDRGVTFKDFWFNGYHHLEKGAFEDVDEDSDLESFGAVQGERLTKALVDQRWPWNRAFGGRSVVIPDDGALPVVELEGGMRLTLLGPTWPKLERMRGQWKKEVEKAGLVPGAHVPAEDEQLEPGEESFGPLDEAEVERLAALPFDADTSKANGSSIALLAEFGGRRALLTGDAQADLLESTIDRLPDGGNQTVAVDAFKISHHGSRKTLSSELLQKIQCSSFLISSDGSRHKHPDREALARVLKSSDEHKDLVFNYRTEFTLAWDIRRLKRSFDYATTYPQQANNGTMRIDLI